MAGGPQRLTQAGGLGGIVGRLAVAQSAQSIGIGSMLIATARQLARETIARSGGVGLVADAANEEVVEFYAKYGFLRVTPKGLRMFLPTASLEGGVEVAIE